MAGTLTFSHDAVRILGSHMAHKETIDGALYCEYENSVVIEGNVLCSFFKLLKNKSTIS